MAENKQQDTNRLLQVRRDKLAELQAAGKDPFEITKYDVTNHSEDVKETYIAHEAELLAGRPTPDVEGLDDEQKKEVLANDYNERRAIMDGSPIHVSIAGRMMFKRVMGKASFCNIQDLKGNIQVYVARDVIGEESYADFKKSDIGDIYGVKGYYNALNEDVKLRISLELYLKRLIVGGLERVFEIGRVFRNEGVDTRHNPEFTLMELYQAYTDYEGMMELTESMFRYLAEKVCGSTKISYNGIEIDFGKPFERLTMNDAIKKYTGIDFDQVADDAEAKKLADENHIAYEDRHKKGDIINLFFEEFCEEKLIQPTFIMDHPIEISPLTKKKPSDPSKVERFELFINTWEMCNAYSELNDPIDQRERFAAQDANAAAGDDEAEHTDEDFLNALEIGMPPTGGIGYGIDRLVMLLTDSQAIRDVLLFPTMKTLDK